MSGIVDVLLRIFFDGFADGVKNRVSVGIGAVALHEAIEGCHYAEGVNRFIAIVRIDGVKVHLHHQLIHNPPIDGVNGAGVVVVERSFGVGDCADVAHGTSSYNALTIISQVGGMG